MKKIFENNHKNIYKIRAGITGLQYLITERNNLTLVDTGLPGSHSTIIQNIKRLGFLPENLSVILITHADFDHYGSAAAIKQLTGAKVYATHIEAQSMIKGQMSRQLNPQGLEKIYNIMLPLYKTSPVEVDWVLENGEELDILDGLSVIDSAGHTPGHISFYSSKYGVLFSGDSIKIRRKVLSVYKGGTTWNIHKARGSLQRQTGLQIKLICAGHRTRFL